MPLQATSGAASQDAFGGNGVAAAVNYIEDMFSTYLYTGNGSTQTITNGIDLSGKGGLTWIKYRDGAFGNGHFLYDTVRGAGKALQSNLTNAETAADSRFTSFNSNGFSLDVAGGSAINASTYPYVSWTFRKQPKFFDIVTYTGNGGVQNIAHNLGSVPGCIMVKSTSQVSNWAVYHTSLGNTQFLAINQTNAAVTLNYWNNTSPTSTQFTVNGYQAVGSAGETYVAYLFAHNAGGFGLTGTDNVISCGSFNNAVPSEVVLGWEPQWLLIKSVNASNWHIIDTMRGMSNTGQNLLAPNLTNAEIPQSQYFIPTATGFYQNIFFGDTTIYIAIRRGPMKVPTLGTSVYNAIARTGTGANANVTGVGFSPDLVLSFDRTNAYGSIYPWRNKLAGKTQMLSSASTAAEVTEGSDALTAFIMDGISVGADATNTANLNTSGVTYIQHFFKRAPSSMDVVCYTGTGVGGRTVTHNLTVAPELIIAKNRSGAANLWLVYSQPTGASGVLQLASNAALVTPYFDWVPTSTTFSVGAQGFGTNDSGINYVAYLFATCAGVSKVGSYTGTGALQTVNCGFTSGARFVLIKRTDSTGAWYVWDSTRGIVAGNDPYLLINSFAAEVTNTDYIDTYSAGFEISSTAPAAINANGGSFIFFAVA